jgi:hypothetical protein
MGKLDGEYFISLHMMKSLIIAATSIVYVITAVTTSNAGTQTRKNNNVVICRRGACQGQSIVTASSRVGTAHHLGFRHYLLK